MDAITFLKDEHKAVAKLLRELGGLGDRALVRRKKLTDQVVEALSKHIAIEEAIFYPRVREEVDGTDDDILESLEEHHLVKWTLEELRHLEPSDERFDAKVTVLTELVRHHVEEEETGWFPKVRKAIGRRELAEIGAQLQAARAKASAKPLPERVAGR